MNIQLIKNYDYNPYITAISRTKKSAPLSFLLDNKLITNSDKVLDFGAGRLRDVLELKTIGVQCKAYDKYADYYSPKDENLLEEEFDVVMSNYMFNTISTKKEHFNTLKKFRKIKSKRKLISVRNDFKAIKDAWVYDEKNETFFTGKSFQRFFDIQELNKWFGKHRLLEKKSNYLILELL